MMAPNPHWWAEDAVVYFYRRGRFSPLLFVVIFWLLFICLPIIFPASKPFIVLVPIFGLLILFVHISAVREPPPHRFETRFTHLTQYSNGEILVHESMRDLVSLEPVMNSKNGCLKFHEATFWNGKTIKIYPSLDRHEELISKLQKYLAGNKIK